MKKLTIYGMVLIALTLGIIPLTRAQTPFKSYWTMDRKSGTTNYADSTGLYPLNLTDYGGTYIQENGNVQKCLKLSSNNSNLMVLGSAGSITGSFTFEIAFKTGQNFHGAQFFRDQQGNFECGFSVKSSIVPNYSNNPQLSIFFNIGNDSWEIPLDGLDVKSMGYYLTGWHHMVFKYDSPGKLRTIWVDGKNPVEFRKVTPSISYTCGTIWMNHTVNYRRFDGWIDEVAYSNTPLSNYLIYQHYQNFASGNHYQNTTNINSIPNPPATSAPVDSLDFPKGWPNNSMSILDQGLKSPVARYRTNHQLDPLARWTDNQWTFGRYNGYTDNQSLQNQDTLTTEWWRNYNYLNTIQLTGNSWQTQAVTTANNHPGMKSMLITLRAQIPGCQLKRKDLAPTQYLRNSSGQYLDYNGNVTNDPNSRYWAPSGDPSVYNADGTFMKNAIVPVNNSLNTKLYLINEDGEVLADEISSEVMQLDPRCVTGAAAAGLSLKDYYARKFTEMESTSYRNIILSGSGLNNTLYSLYNMDGFPSYSPSWKEARKTNTLNQGEYLSTPDFYPRYPYAWRTGVGAFQSVSWMIKARKSEIELGDKHTSPFVAAGYNTIDTLNILPAQWLGLLKAYLPLGVRFYYAGWFDEAPIINQSNPPADPRKYIYQIQVPAYAQACVSYAEDIMKYGDALCGDFPTSYDPPEAGCGYNFWCGDPRMLITARKYQSKYLIAACLNPLSNMKGAVEPYKDVTINLEGITTKLRVRKQGSMYILDKSGSSPVWYELDTWHESTHPSRWTDEYIAEAEVADTLVGGSRITYPNAPNDYSVWKTTIKLGAGNYASYKPVLRNVKNRYLFIKAKGSGSIAVKWDTNGDSTITTAAPEQWYRLSLGSVTGQHSLKITSNSPGIEIDQWVITDSLNKYPVETSPCTGFVATTTAGTDSVCIGNTTTITCNQTSVSYIWSNGSTSKTITVGPGTYTVTINNGTCIASSTPITIYSKVCTTCSGPTNLVAVGGPMSLTCSWTPVAGVTGYKLELWSDTIMTRSLGQYQYISTNLRSTTTSLKVGGLLKKAYYYWRVTAICPGNVEYYTVGNKTRTL